MGTTRGETAIGAVFGMNAGPMEQARGHRAEAEAQYRKALAIDSQFYLSAVNLAILLNEQGRNDEAEALLEQAARANPHDAAASFNLGLLLAEMGKPSQAETALRAALATDPDLSAAAYNLAILIGEREPAQAAELCRKPAERHPEEPKYAFSLAYYDLQSGRERDAMKTLQQCVAAHPDYTNAVLLLGDLLVRQQRTREAAALYDRLLSSPTVPEDERAAVASRRAGLR